MSDLISREEILKLPQRKGYAVNGWETYIRVSDIKELTSIQPPKSAYLLFFKFILDHPDMGLIINYEPIFKGVSFTMDVHPKRKRVVFDPEAIEQLSLDVDSIVLEYLEDMYKELTESNEEEK